MQSLCQTVLPSPVTLSQNCVGAVKGNSFPTGSLATCSFIDEKRPLRASAEGRTAIQAGIRDFLPVSSCIPALVVSVGKKGTQTKAYSHLPETNP